MSQNLAFYQQSLNNLLTFLNVHISSMLYIIYNSFFINVKRHCRFKNKCNLSGQSLRQNGIF
jgi:hypothetical protein